MNLQKPETLMEETTTPVRSQNWIEEQLIEIEEIKEPQIQVEELLRLASKLLPSASEVLKDALNAAQNIEDDFLRSQALAAIVPNLSETERPKVLKDALDAAQNIEDQWNLCQALAVIGINLPETERPKVLKDALDVAQNIEDEWNHCQALAVISPYFCLLYTSPSPRDA